MNSETSSFAEAVRTLRKMRNEGAAFEEQERFARLCQRNTGVEWRLLISEAAKPDRSS